MYLNILRFDPSLTKHRPTLAPSIMIVPVNYAGCWRIKVCTFEVHFKEQQARRANVWCCSGGSGGGCCRCWRRLKRAIRGWCRVCYRRRRPAGVWQIGHNCRVTLQNIWLTCHHVVGVRAANIPAASCLRHLTFEVSSTEKGSLLGRCATSWNTGRPCRRPGGLASVGSWRWIHGWICVASYL
jgi:hypothetical protein